MQLILRSTLFLTLFLPGWALGQDYVRTLTDGGTDVCVTWNQRVFDYSVDVNGSEKTPGNTEFDAITAAFAEWQRVSNVCSDFQFVEGEPVSDFKIGNVSGSAANNVITFREDRCDDVAPATDSCWADKSCDNKYKCWDGDDATIALTTISYNSRTGVIFDADVEFNAAPRNDGGTNYLFTAVDSPKCSSTSLSVSCVASDIQNTLTHEIGHVLGFDHTLNRQSLMYPNAEVGEISKRTIDEGTARGFCETYPRGQLFATPCDPASSLRRRIVAKSDGTPGFASVGCSASGGMLQFGLALLAIRLMLRRRD